MWTLLCKEEISRQLAHCKDLTRDAETAKTQAARRTKLAVDLRSFEKRNVQFRIVVLQSRESFFQLATSHCTDAPESTTRVHRAL
jgi:hypothetical protein